MRRNFLALDRYLRKYREKTKRSAARGFSFASNRKSLPISVLKLKGHIIPATMYLLLSARPLWVILGNFDFLDAPTIGELLSVAGKEMTTAPFGQPRTARPSRPSEQTSKPLSEPQPQ